MSLSSLLTTVLAIAPQANAAGATDTLLNCTKSGFDNGIKDSQGGVAFRWDSATLTYAFKDAWKKLKITVDDPRITGRDWGDVDCFEPNAKNPDTGKMYLWAYVTIPHVESYYDDTKGGSPHFADFKGWWSPDWSRYMMCTATSSDPQFKACTCSGSF